MSSGWKQYKRSIWGCGTRDGVPDQVWENHVSVLMAPLNAILAEVSESLTRDGIVNVVWDRTCGTIGQDVSVVCISHEHAVCEEFSDLIGTLRLANRMWCIVIDEAHMGVLDRDFRERFNKLHRLGSTLFASRPVLLLSATISLETQQQLPHVYGLRVIPDPFRAATILRKDIKILRHFATSGAVGCSAEVSTDDEGTAASDDANTNGEKYGLCASR